jgi:hypothetical protein
VSLLPLTLRQPTNRLAHIAAIKALFPAERKRIELPSTGSLEKTHRPPLTGQAEYRYFPEVLDTRRRHHHP